MNNKNLTRKTAWKLNRYYKLKNNLEKMGRWSLYTKTLRAKFFLSR